MSSFLDLYCSQRPVRFKTPQINIGGVLLGGNQPIRIQSMTNTDTNDTVSTVAQCIQLADAGCELIRLTAQGEREAFNLFKIKGELRSKGYRTPLIADIHFNPKVAEIAAGIVEKVRINPGNYFRNTNLTTYSEKEYELELEQIAENLYPLLKVCRQHGTAIRVGTNHGSLGKRILDRFGDTPQGMVESALEFARMFANQGFKELVLSMKASNVLIMVQATRLLSDRMMEENLFFPIHLGVTEAGEGEEGAIKSAVGIGTLLEDGIGDTIRVSLTGDPVKEIPVALEIARRYNARFPEEIGKNSLPYPSKDDFSPFQYRKRTTIEIGNIGHNNPVQVLGKANGHLITYDENGREVLSQDMDFVKQVNLIDGTIRDMRRDSFAVLNNNDLRPIILSNSYFTANLLRFQVNAAIDFGAMLVDGIGDAIMPLAPAIERQSIIRTAFDVLQSTRTRITRTEYISCPSCGRTLFDIETTLQSIKAATSHLTGLKIAVMGCIVNGPGEMADADYGYVGAGKGKITLYKGNEVVGRNIPEEDAIKALTELIRQSGDWKEIDVTE